MHELEQIWHTGSALITLILLNLAYPKLTYATSPLLDFLCNIDIGENKPGTLVLWSFRSNRRLEEGH